MATGSGVLVSPAGANRDNKGVLGGGESGEQGGEHGGGIFQQNPIYTTLTLPASFAPASLPPSFPSSVSVCLMLPIMSSFSLFFFPAIPL